MTALIERLRLNAPADDGQQPQVVIQARRWIISISLLLSVFGTVMVFSTSTVLSFRNHNTAYNYGLKHLLSVVLGVGCLVIGMRLSQRWWRRQALWLLPLAGFVLLATYLFASKVGGQKNWVSVGGFKLQPSEFAKIPLVLCIAIAAGMISVQSPQWKRFWGQFACIAAVLIGPVVLAGDAGTPAIMAPLALGMVFVAGAPWRPLGYITLLGAIAGAGLVLHKSYRLQRLGSNWFNPTADAGGGGYQSTHGQYAIAGGGLFGVGLGSGREKWGGLPAAHTDFILASIAEETGLIAAALVIAALAIVAYWFLRIAALHEELTPRVVCAGMGIWIGWQSIVNIAMVVGALPVIGVTLPLVSYGGSSMVATLAGIGMGVAFLRIER